MAMDAFLAEHYGNNKTAAAASQEDLQKQASVELFMKLAADQNIDLNALTEDQVNQMYTNWVQKTAAPEEKHEEKKEDLKEKAKEEHEEKKAQAEKIAEADFLGRIIAHSCVAEMRKIAEATGGAAAAGAVAALPKVAAAAKTAEIPEAFKKHMEGKKEEGKEEKKDEKKDEHKEHHGKEASAIDRLALDHAVALAKEAKLDPEVAGQKCAAVLILGQQPDDTKIAAAGNLDAAIHIRALELLEKAGYEVSYN